MFPVVLAVLLLQSGPPAAAAPADLPAPQVHARRAAPPAPPPIPRAPAAGPLVGEWPSKPSGKRVTLDGTLSLDDALERIAREAGWNVVLNTGRTGNAQLVLKLRDVPVEEALRAALGGSGLEATRQGDTVVVAPSLRGAASAPTLSGFDKPTGKRFTGEFDEAPIGEALRKIAASAGLSIVVPPGIEGEVTASFRDVPAEDALRAVLAQGNLVAEREGGVVTVRAAPVLPGFPAIPDARRMADLQRQVARAQRDVEELPGGGRGHDRVQSGDVTIHAGERVRDVVAIRGNVRLEAGASARDVVAVLGGIRMDAGSRAREATAVMGDVELGPGAELEKDVTSVGGKVKADPSAVIGGESTSVGVPEVGLFSSVMSLVGAGILAKAHLSPIWLFAQTLAKFAIYFALGLLLFAIFPRRVEGVASAMVANPWKSVLTGLLGLVVLPFLAVLLVVTVIGIPLVAVVALLVLVAGILGFTALAFHIGRSLPLPADRRSWVLQLAVGTAIVVVLTQIPIFGTLAWVAAALLTFGAALRSRLGQHGPILPTTAVSPPPAAP
jgi:Secretin and TonB N terminus short domain